MIDIKERTKENKEWKSIRLKSIEEKILKFVHEFGFCHIGHIMQKFDLQKSSAYEHMNFLTRLQLLIHEPVMDNAKGVYYLTYKAISLLRLDLPVVRHVPLAIYSHQLAVVQMHFKLIKAYPEATWLTERRFIKSHYQPLASQVKIHIPDGVLLFPTLKQCAIEVERTRKEKDRLIRIVRSYGLQRTFKEVWYFCSLEVLPALHQIAKELPYVKVYALQDYLN